MCFARQNMKNTLKRWILISKVSEIFITALTTQSEKKQTGTKLIQNFIALRIYTFDTPSKMIHPTMPTGFEKGKVMRDFCRS